MSASPPELSSSPPIFEPPPLPNSLTNVSTLPLASQPLAGRLPLSPALHLAAVNATLGSTGTVSGPVPSTFPSPGSAFTELHPRNGTASHTRNCPFSPARSDHHSTSTVTQTKHGTTKTNSAQMNTSSGGSSHSSSHSSAPSPIQYDALSSSASSARSFACVTVYCRLCGQSHDPTAPHRYNYTQAVDADLCCSVSFSLINGSCHLNRNSDYFCPPILVLITTGMQSRRGHSESFSPRFSDHSYSNNVSGLLHTS